MGCYMTNCWFCYLWPWKVLTNYQSIFCFRILTCFMTVSFSPKTSLEIKTQPDREIPAALFNFKPKHPKIRQFIKQYAWTVVCLSKGTTDQVVFTTASAGSQSRKMLKFMSNTKFNQRIERFYPKYTFTNIYDFLCKK